MAYIFLTPNILRTQTPLPHLSRQNNYKTLTPQSSKHSVDLLTRTPQPIKMSITNMNPLCHTSHTPLLKLPPLLLLKTNLSLPPPSLKHTHSTTTTFLKPTVPLIPKKPPLPPATRRRPIHSTLSDRAAASEIDMFRNKDGIYSPKQSKVVVLWDLDNKPPRGPPYQAAVALKLLAQRFGHVVDISAYANRHAFIHLPDWVLQERRERRHLDVLERKGLSAPSQPYICSVCGRKCKTHLDLKKHFRQLHERERQKKLNRMRSLKGKKRQRYKEKNISGNHKYNEAARDLVTPRVGYGLASELRRAGVYVRTVEDKPQAADWAVKRQMQHSMSRGVDWLVLVSDDSDFSEMLRRAREAELGTVVVGDWDRALGRHADLWVPWIRVENGEVSERDLVPKGKGGSESGLDGLVEEIADMRMEINGVKISAFSEGEEGEGEWVTEEFIDGGGGGDGDGDFLLWDSEDEETEGEDGYGYF